VEKIIDRIRTFVKGIMREIASLLNELTVGKVKPYQITILSVLLHGLIVLAIYNDQLFQAGIMLIAFGLMDAIDGALARIQGSESNGGVLLDFTADRIKEIMLYSVIGYWFVINEGAGYSVYAALALGGSILATAVKTKGEVIISRVDNKMNSQELNRFFSKGIMRFEIRMFLLVIALLSGEMLLVVAFIALFSWITAFSQLFRILIFLSDSNK